MIFEDFGNELQILKDLFGNEFIETRLKTLNKIFEASESYWNKNLKYIFEKNIKIKYLLICEAPPYCNIRAKEEVKYFYNPDNTSVPQSYLEAVFNTFYPHLRRYRAQYTAEEKQIKLNKIADKGFLLIDSLPFAMNYSDPNNIRDNEAYKKLIKSCTESYLIKKLTKSNIPWKGKVKIAFSVYRNGREVIKNWPSNLPLKNTINPEERDRAPFEHIAVNGSWNLNENDLGRIFQMNCGNS